MNYLPSDSDFNKQYNLRILYNRISSYYEYVPNYVFDYKDNSDENMLKLGELILGICGNSPKEEYLEILPENESNEVYKLLRDLVPLDDEKRQIKVNKRKKKKKKKKKMMIKKMKLLCYGLEQKTPKRKMSVLIKI